MTTYGPRMTPQERIILAKRLSKQAKNQKFTRQKRQKAMSAAWNLLAINMMEAKRKNRIKLAYFSQPYLCRDSCPDLA
jgi:hypothetical protein